MTTIIQQFTGETCEPCIAYHNGVSEYFESDSETLGHVSRHAQEWNTLGDVVLDSVEDEPQPHFGHSCIVCGFPPYAGTVYDYTLTIFQR